MNNIRIARELVRIAKALAAGLDKNDIKLNNNLVDQDNDENRNHVDDEKRIRLFKEKKKQFDQDYDSAGLYKCEADLDYLNPRIVKLYFWVNSNCTPDIYKVPLSSFIEEPLDKLPHWDHIQGYGTRVWGFDHVIK